MSILGLDIGSKYIKAVVASGPTRAVQHAYMLETPPFAVKDGELKDIQAVAGVVTNLIATKKIKIRELYIALKSPQLTNREVKLPKMKQEEIHSAIEFDLSQIFPNIQQANTVSHVQYTKPGTPFTGLAVFCPTKILDGYMRLAEAIGAPLFRIDAGFNSALRAAENFGLIKYTPDSLVFLDVGAESSQVTIVSGGSIALSRHMAFEMSYAATASDGVSETAADRTDYSPIIDQLVQTLDYYKYTRTEEPHMTGIYLLGGGSHNEELIALLEERLSLPVKRLDVKIKGIENSADLYLAAVGSLLKKPQRFADVNLLPDFRALTREKASKRRQTVAVGFVALFAILFAGAFSLLQYQELLVKQDAESLSQRMVIYSEVNTVKQDIASANKRIETIGSILETAQNSALLNTDLLDDIMSSMPQGIFIQSYSASSGTITMTGIGQTRPDIAEFIRRLSLQEAFSGVTVGSISARLDKDGNETDFSFNLTLSLT